MSNLIAKDYQSEQRFAESVFRYRLSRGFGWCYIQNELQQKGVNSTIITALNPSQEIDWYLQAELAYNKRFADKEIKDQKDKAKRIRFLQYRGFSTEQIMTILQTD